MAPSNKIPRVVVAATASGVGKTTATVALIGALRACGLKVASFKCGPDYLDPTYHQRASGVRSHNLDGWMMGHDAVVATFARASAGADIAVIEGMMGLFDSATPTGEDGSTAQIAKWLGAPVLLVTEASGVARTIAAIAAGFARFDPAVRVAGMICIRVGSRGHLELLRAARPEVPAGADPIADHARHAHRRIEAREAGCDRRDSACYSRGFSDQQHWGAEPLRDLCGRAVFAGWRRGIEQPHHPFDHRDVCSRRRARERCNNRV